MKGSTNTSMPSSGKAAEKPGHGAQAAAKGSCSMSMPQSPKSNNMGGKK